VMKTAVSLPDELFRSAEVTAKRLRISRSRLYAHAIAEFLERRSADAITKRLNEVYSRKPAKAGSAMLRAMSRSLEIDAW
jgi:hypothetical protein